MIGNKLSALTFTLLMISFMIQESAGASLLCIEGVPASDTILEKDEGSRQSLFTGFGYGSNMVYMGSSISGNQPFGYGSLIYGLDSKLYASVSSIHLSGLDPFLQLYSGSVSFSHVFNSWFDISSSVTGYRVHEAIRDSLLSDFIYGDFTVGIDWRLLYTTLSVGGLISNETSAYFQVKNSRYFKTPKFFREKVFISFDPYVNVLLGNLTKSETTSVITGVTSTTSSGRWGFGKQQSQSVQTTDYVTTPKSFALLGIDFGLPVSINTGRFTFDTEVGYFLPAYSDNLYPAPEGLVFTLGATIRIF
jgi:hypothetical protein